MAEEKDSAKKPEELYLKFTYKKDGENGYLPTFDSNVPQDETTEEDTTTEKNYNRIRFLLYGIMYELTGILDRKIMDKAFDKLYVDLLVAEKLDLEKFVEEHPEYLDKYEKEHPEAVKRIKEELAAKKKAKEDK